MLTEHFSLLAPSVSHEGLGRWRSPELVNSDSKVVVPTAAADVWALGCTLFEVNALIELATWLLYTTD